MAMARQTLANHFPVQGVQCGEQGRGSVAFVVVSHGFRSTPFHRQARLGAIESLNLALLIHAQHEGVFWRIEIKPYYVLELLNKMGVSTQLEGANPVRLQPMVFPDALDTGWTQAYYRRQASRAPVSSVKWLLLKRPFHNLTHLSVLNSLLTSRPTPVLKQTRNPICLVAVTPPGDRWSSRAKLPHDLARGHPIGTEQHDTRSKRQLLRRIPISYHLSTVPDPCHS